MIKVLEHIQIWLDTEERFAQVDKHAKNSDRVWIQIVKHNLVDHEYVKQKLGRENIEIMAGK